MLNEYANSFPTVEINYTFYRLPTEKTFQNWRRRVPDTFQFVLKGSKLITHQYKLVGVEDALEIFLERALLLRPQLGPILFQLPPSLHYDLSRLEKFLQLLPDKFKYVVEFRHNSWINEKTFQLLREYQVAYCIVSGPRQKYELVDTAPFVYFRFHGSDRWYQYNYSEEELKEWAKAMRKFLNRGLKVYGFFNNDFQAYAPQNAKRRQELLKI